MTNKQKDLWERLAKKNPNYYINSDYGKGITDVQFVKSGERDYERLIVKDDLLYIPSENKDKVFVEIGCGTGRMTEFIASDYKQVIGFDISGEMIRLGRERLKECANVVLCENDGMHISLPDHSVDIVFSYLVFQHMKSYEMVESNFREIFRILKKYGLFKVNIRTDQLDDLDSWWSGVSYDEYEIDKLCDAVGFTLLKREYVKHYAVWLWLEK